MMFDARSRGTAVSRRVAARLMALTIALPGWTASAEEPRPAQAAPADVQSADSKFSKLSLEELLNVRIFVASRREEKISEAPAAITAYTLRDLRSTGYFTLSELADITAGYSSYTIYGERVFETRGQKAGSFNNNKHLLYVDGIPVNHARNYKAPIEEELPLFFAQRVEFLRGPASALYGTGAFFGVVNVVPKRLDGPGTLVEGRVSAGSRDGERRVASNFVHSDAQREARISVGYYDKQASRDFVGTVDDPNNLFWDDQKSVFLNAAYEAKEGTLRGVALGFVYLRKNGGLGEHWMEAAFSSELNDLTWETVIPYVKYDRQVSSKLQLSGYLLQNVGREKGWWSPFTKDSFGTYDGTGTPFQAYDTQVDSLQSLLEGRWTIAKNLDLTSGVNIDTRRQKGDDLSYGFAVNGDPGEPYVSNATLRDGSGRYTTYSVYTQLRHELPVLQGLVVTLGAREDYGSSPAQHYSQLSPRLGLVQKLTPHLNLRAFYGTALRAPGLKEVELNNESREILQNAGLSTSGIVALKAETIKSLEVGASYNSGNLALGVNYFGNRTRNALDGRAYNGVNIFGNSDGITKASGLELEAQYATSEDFRVFANYAWARARDRRGRELQDVPVQTGTFGLSYRTRVPIDLTSSAVAHWVDSYRVSGEGARPEGEFVVDLNFVLALTKSLGLEVQARNITGEVHKLPKNGVPDVPLPGRRAQVSLTYGF